MIVVCDLYFLDEIQVHQEDGWLRPVPEQTEPIKVKQKEEKISPTSQPVASESLVVIVEGVFKGLT